jgi:hypothetical protein
MGAEAVEKFRRWVVEDGASGSLPEGLADFQAPELTKAADLFYQYVLEGVPEKRWHHDCPGILGKDMGEGSDVVWVACSGFTVNAKQLKELGLPKEGLPAEMTARTMGPGEKEAAGHGHWVPSNPDYKRYNDLSAKKVKATPDGGSIRIRAGGALMLVGDDHDPNAENYMRQQPDLSEGKLTVKKGGAFSRGSFQVDGISLAKRNLVEQALGKFSEKKVTFS